MVAAAQHPHYYQDGSEVGAMILPDWPMVRITRRKETVQSRGINYSDNYGDGDLAGSENLSVRRWPYIATRNGRKRVEGIQSVTALTSWNGLVAIRPGDHDGTWEDEVLYRGEHAGWLEHTDKPRQFAAVNTKLVIWPDKAYLDLNAKTIKPLGAALAATGATVAVTEGTKDGKVTNTTTITFTTDKDLTTMFHANDGVELSGFTNAANNRALVIQSVAAKKITVDTGDFVNETATGKTITLERKIPAFDYICESGNRLWGVSNADKTIYSSSLGDPTNFYVTRGISTDSYAVAVATAGDFTGCCKLSSSVLFWKEETLHKILGNYPAEYVMYTYEMEGVRAGCGKSMTIINGALYYVGLHSVYSYAGGTPADISSVFGEHTITEAVGGTDGEKYFLSCLDDGEEALYVFAPHYGVWLREDSFRAVDITREGEDAYLLRRDGSVWIADSREQDEQIEWSMEYKPYFETIEGRKRVSRLLIRMEIPEGTWLRVETSTDDEPWQEAGLIKGPRADTVPLQIQPRRGDQYKVRLRGHGPCVIKGVLREYLQGGYQGGYD